MHKSKLVDMAGVEPASYTLPIKSVLHVWGTGLRLRTGSTIGDYLAHRGRFSLATFIQISEHPLINGSQ